MKHTTKTTTTTTTIARTPNSNIKISDKKFWDIHTKNKLEEFISKEGNWIGHNKETEAGDYLPNEFKRTKSGTSSCGTSSKSGFIIGGEDAKLGEFPFVATLGIYFYIYIKNNQYLRA